MIAAPFPRCASGGKLRRGLSWMGGVLGISILLAAAPGTHAGQPDDHIWTALVLASNAETPKPVPAELSTFASKLERVFGYNQFELIGTATKTIDEDVERWLVPTPNFWLSAKARRNGENAYLLDLVLYQDKRCLVETQAKLGANSPLLIRGPVHARGQLIIVLKVER